jgi:TonB family protein
VEEQVAPEQQKQEPRTTTTAVANEYVPSGFNAARNVEPDTDVFAAWRNLPPPLPVKRTFRLRTVSPRSVLLAFGIGLLVFLLATGALQWTATGPQESANAAAPEESLAKPESDNTDVANAGASRRNRGAVGRAKRPATAENEASPSQRFATVQDSQGDFAIPASDQDKSSRAPHANTISEENQLASASPATPGRDAYVDIVNSQPAPNSTDGPRQLYIPATTARTSNTRAASGARPATASPTLREGKLVSYIKPVYPRQALRSHLEGTVVLRAIISPSGSVRAANHLSGDRLLSAAAIDAVKKWKYEPFLLNGRPTEVEKQISVSFSIPD